MIEGLETIDSVIRETRFSNKSDFYGLFAAVNELTVDSTALDLEPTGKSLTRLSRALEAPPETFSGSAREYYTTVAEGANKYAKRVRRMELLRDLMSENL